MLLRSLLTIAACRRFYDGICALGASRSYIFVGSPVVLDPQLISVIFDKCDILH